ncbi:phosphotriesterase-related protein [Brevibacterium epidermidis]|uniref:phosphotriesterase-related protein n=1 Tax=Brevibacterium epidermidis TaxID=1698 RepID=UPI000A5A877F|nr:phosphotriesterase-related protein [Brevibacterium epidermidis]
MAEVQTVTGTIDSSELGRTLVHEHIFVLSEEMRQNYDTAWDDEEKIADAVAKLNDLKAAGIDTIFDPTVVGLGRYIPRVQRVAEQTELNIVAATGLYTFTDLPHQFEGRAGAAAQRVRRAQAPSILGLVHAGRRSHWSPARQSGLRHRLVRGR